MTTFSAKQAARDLSQLLRAGNPQALSLWLTQCKRQQGAADQRQWLNQPTEPWLPQPPLLLAAGLPACTPELLACLHAHGADIDAKVSSYGLPQTALRAALGAGNLASAQWLVGAGAYLNYSWEGYTALIDAVHGHDVLRDPHLLDTLQWLIDAGTDLDGVTRYGESGLRVLSRVGRFDAVALLAAAGADTAQLDFSPLHWAVALGDDLERLSACIDQRPETLEARDWWSRTPLLLAAQAGRVPQFEMLRTRGADLHALARCDKPVLHHAVDGDHVAMLSHLLALPVDAEQADQFGNTALMAASEQAAVRTLEQLLAHPVEIDTLQHVGQTALALAQHKEVVARLLQAGASPTQLTKEGVRATLGFTPEPDPSLLDCSASAFNAGRVRRFAHRNGEDMTTPYALGMIRSGITAYAAMQYLHPSPDAVPRFGADAIPPVWCASRFGQSLTFLPDGRIVQIGGEHEDSYDPDFCIYNDVFVHHPDGEIRVYGYPEDVFPPTDFHSATWVDGCDGPAIVVIGCLGYPAQRTPRDTPVFRLRVRDWTMHPVATHGDAPGWIYKHTARARSPHEIEIEGGERMSDSSPSRQAWAPNHRRYVLDLRTGAWRGTDTAPQ